MLEQHIQEEDVSVLLLDDVRHKNELQKMITHDSYKTHAMRVMAQKILLDKLEIALTAKDSDTFHAVLSGFTRQKLETGVNERGRLTMEQAQNETHLNALLLTAAQQGQKEAVIQLVCLGADIRTQNERKQNAFHLLMEKDPFLSFGTDAPFFQTKDAAVAGHRLNLSALNPFQDPQTTQHVLMALTQPDNAFLTPPALMIKRLPSPLIGHAHPRAHALYEAKLDSIDALAQIGYDFNTPEDFPMHQPLVIAHTQPHPDSDLIERLLRAGADYPTSESRTKLYKSAAVDVKNVMRRFICDKQKCSPMTAYLYLYGIMKDHFVLTRRTTSERAFFLTETHSGRERK